jgi:DNA-binding PadR family transcriptional regulator
MMGNNEEIVKLTARQILMFLVDFAVVSYSMAHKSPMARKSVNDYWRWRRFDRARFSSSIYRLKKQKLIRVYIEGKEKYLELTPKGLARLRKYTIDQIEIERPKVWDRQWRIVIFDIPDRKRVFRDILRRKLERLGFILLQESVFIFPFECKREIDYICDYYLIKPYLKYIVADILEGDQDLIEEFIDKEVLLPSMIKKID